MKAYKVLNTLLVGSLVLTPKVYASEHIDELEATVEEAIADSVASEEQSKSIREKRELEKQDLAKVKDKALAETADARAKSHKAQKEITRAEWAIESMQKTKQKLLADQRREEAELQKKLANLDQLKAKKGALSQEVVLAEKNLNGTREHLAQTRRNVIETQDSTNKMIVKLDNLRKEHKEESARLAQAQANYKQHVARLKGLEEQQKQRLAALQTEKAQASVELKKLQQEVAVREQRTKAYEAQAADANQRTKVVVAKLEQMKINRLKTLKAMQNRELLAQSNLKASELREARARSEMSQLPTLIPAKTVVISRDCNIRTEPTADARSLGVIRGGSKVKVAGRAPAGEQNSSIWQKIELPSHKPAYASMACFKKDAKIAR